MARDTTPTPSVVLPKKVLSPAEISLGLERLAARVSDLRSFDIATVRQGTTPELKALEVAINDTLTRCFGHNTAAYNQFQSATGLGWYPRIQMSGAPDPDYVSAIGRKVQRAIALLEQAQKTLEEDLTDLAYTSQANTALSSQRVFVVHGHDEAALQGLARFLEKLGLEAIILREQPDQGRTIIEKFEDTCDDIGFAVVLLTPDDIGSTVNATDSRVRARQNVIFELGYFAGKLGRGRVCLLKKGDVEIPSDLYGVVYTEMDPAEGWQTRLVRELKAANLEFDANRIWS